MRLYALKGVITCNIMIYYVLMEDTLGIMSLSKALVASQTSCCVGRFGGPVARAAGLLRDIQRDVPRNLQRTAEIGSGNFGTDCDDCANMAPIPMLIMLASSSFTAVKLNLERLHLKQKSPSFAALHVQFQSYTATQSIVQQLHFFATANVAPSA